ncbi:3-keto-5-aminohexanoate cleavage protein [Mesorhizobium sp. B2-5-13]|uniref:3-keto-5-aminohexanoate cleavage protein n=1 Tax=unclassified Mesorhizobium TaxID=325217 RepID=UPI00112A84B6|nr:MULTISPECIES: 3-keto-5-aminohexanoate cleavage protein [unclassified Mesorhizobium]TPJ37675.1 3-keto-5-aminohexanoate cleavage protein [Mesorhizobium sp. B2-6-5]TPJ76519.1 3-keto-5-aminohexanoate cleavage protein [Mesorhizobium sp. B2-5-13]TPK42710.1 3-keto-5-aminohexanoate cleavage protein [Mesorhizobium sp. B2-5-5]
MIVQACINGARPRDFHPRLPLTAQAMAGDAASCVAAGAAELHIHPRGADGRESLAAVDMTVLAVRQACPGTLIGVSTGAWIENDVARTRAAIAAWRELPDYASVNLSEPDAPEVMELLRKQGIGIEAGLATTDDAERFVALADHSRVLRILIEIDIPDLPTALDEARGIAAVLERAGVRRQILLHGVDGTVWPFVDLARQKRWSTRVGLEDGNTLSDGTVARDNAEIVAAAAANFRSTSMS